MPDYRLQGQDVLRFQLALEVEQELPVVLFLLADGSIIWGYRAAGKRIELYKIRVDLEAKVSLSSENSYAEVAQTISSMITKLSIMYIKLFIKDSVAFLYLNTLF